MQTPVVTTTRIRYADWGAAEHRAARRAFWWHGHADDVARLERRLGDRLGGASAVHALNAARTGLILALEQFRALEPGRRTVLVPAYVCRSVPDAITAAGCRFEPVAVGDDLNLDATATAARLARGDVLAVVAAHMYGAPAPIADLENACRDAGVFLIDDAAQVVGVEVDGRPLGTFGDVGALSFAQSKTIVTGVGGSGGALFVNDAALRTPLAERVATLPASRGVRGRLLRFYRDYLGEHRTRTAVYYLKRLRLLRPPEARGVYPSTRIDPTEAGIALAQLDSLDQRLQARRAAIGRFRTALAGLERIDTPQLRHDYVTRVMIELPDSSDRTAVRSALLRAGFQTRNGYDVAVLRDAAGQDVDLSRAERLLELPIDAARDAATLDALVAALRVALD